MSCLLDRLMWCMESQRCRKMKLCVIYLVRAPGNDEYGPIWMPRNSFFEEAHLPILHEHFLCLIEWLFCGNEAIWKSVKYTKVCLFEREMLNKQTG